VINQPSFQEILHIARNTHLGNEIKETVETLKTLNGQRSPVTDFLKERIIILEKKKKEKGKFLNPFEELDDVDEYREYNHHFDNSSGSEEEYEEVYEEESDDYEEENEYDEEKILWTEYTDEIK